MKASELPGSTVYVLFQVGKTGACTPIEVTAHPSRAAYRAREWSTVNSPCLVFAAEVGCLFGEPDGVENHAPHSPEDHESVCGLADDCPRKVAAFEGGDVPLSEAKPPLTVEAQLEFDFSDEEPTWPTGRSCHCLKDPSNWEQCAKCC